MVYSLLLWLLLKPTIGSIRRDESWGISFFNSSFNCIVFLINSNGDLEGLGCNSTAVPSCVIEPKGKGIGWGKRVVAARMVLFCNTNNSGSLPYRNIDNPFLVYVQLK